MTTFKVRIRAVIIRIWVEYNNIRSLKISIGVRA